MEGRLVLRGMSGPVAGRVWEVRSVARVGRFEGADIHVDDSSVSRLHAEFRLTALGWRLVDLGSTNGTVVNGAKVGVAQWPLRKRDVIGIGGATLFSGFALLAQALCNGFDTHRQLSLQRFDSC